MVIIFLSEVLIDSIKHFFITRLNRLRSDLYTDFKLQLFRDFLHRTQKGRSEEEDPSLKGAFKFYNSALMDKVFDAETSMALASNLLIIP